MRDEEVEWYRRTMYTFTGRIGFGMEFTGLSSTETGAC